MSRCAKYTSLILSIHLFTCGVSMILMWLGLHKVGDVAGFLLIASGLLLMSGTCWLAYYAGRDDPFKDFFSALRKTFSFR